MLNRAVLTGRLTKDPEVQYTTNGTPVLSFTLAVDRQFRNKQGDRDADFINCVIWRKSAENFANFTHKGALVGIDGRIQTRNYENNQGQRVYVTEVVVDNFALLEPRRQGGNGGGQYNGGQSQYGGGNGSYNQGNNNNYGRGQNNGYGNNNYGGGFQNNGYQNNNNSDHPVEINDEALPFNTNNQSTQSAPQQNNNPSSNPSGGLTADQLPTGGNKPKDNKDDEKKSDNLTNSEDDLPF